MYESMTFEKILSRMLELVPSNMDKREGSIIYDAIAPCASELTIMYLELDIILNETFGDTASREYLVRRAKERGIEPYQSTKAILKGEFNTEVPIGSRFSIDTLFYEVISKIDNYTYNLECEIYGSRGNSLYGTLIPVEYISGLEKAELTELLIPAEDEEDTESFRLRYLNSFNSQAYGGNINDYLEKTNSISGVGGVKVTPVWNGGGTVKLTIINSQYEKANDELINYVQEIVDPNSEGVGSGIAPIGHKVTVNSVNEILVNIKASIIFDVGYSYSILEDKIYNQVLEYIDEERTKWAGQNRLIVRISYIESKILGIDGVLDISNTNINDIDDNLLLGEYDIPVLGVIINS